MSKGNDVPGIAGGYRRPGGLFIAFTHLKAFSS